MDRLRRDNPNSTAAKDPERYIRSLTQYISDRRITLEVCITSNLQSIQNLRKFADHPFGRMVADRLSVTLCTDNRLMSRTTVTKEIASACKAFNLSQDDLRNVIIYGFKRSFYPGSYLEKRAYVRRVIDYYDDVMRAGVGGRRRLARSRGHSLLALPPALAGLLRLDLAVAGRRGGGQLTKQQGGRLRDGVHGLLEGGRVGARRPGRTADLAHVLERRRAHLLVAGRRLKVVEDVNVPAHGKLLQRPPPLAFA